MSEYVSVIFCRNCGSRFVEITEWSEEKKAIFHCRSCNTVEEIKKFTMGRCLVSKKELENGRLTAARLGRDVNYER